MGMRSRCWGLKVAALIGLAGCSFATSATGGRQAVHRYHAWIDAGLSFVPLGGCAFAGIAWVSPDMFAPVQGDRTSWASPQDRADTKEAGATWTPIACTIGALLFASTIYGQVVSPEDASSDLPYLQAAAAFANGFQAAGQAQPAATQESESYAHQTRDPRSCTSDFSCGFGSLCVKRRYSSSGFCAKAVDSTGVQTFDGPDLDSIGPNVGDKSDCEVDGCPAGFRCDRGSGVCLR